MAHTATSKPQLLALAEKSLNYTVYDARWIPTSKRFVTIGSHAKGTGALEVMEFEPNGNGQFALETRASAEPPITLSCGTFHASPKSDRRLAVADFAGNIQLYDLERLGSKVDTSWAAVHNLEKKTIVKAIVGCGGLGIGAGPNELATGAEDGVVKIWDLRQRGEEVVKFTPAADTKNVNLPSMPMGTRACWALAFGNSYDAENRALAAGYDNGDVKLFDLRNLKLYWDENVKNGVTDLEFDRRDIEMNKLAATTLEGHVHCWDCRTLGKQMEFARVSERPHTSTAWRARHLPQNRDVLLTSSGSGHLYLWRYQYPTSRVNDDGEGVPGSLELLQKSAVTTQPITGLDWHPDKLGLTLASSLDQCVRVLVASNLQCY